MSQPQNIYDNLEFFSGYERLRLTGEGLNDALEQPALLSMLPQSLEGLSVLDLGCGFGGFARKIRNLGARSVLGIDISSRMLKKAVESTQDSGIEYRQASIECFDWKGDPFDLVVSSLALHYIDDYGKAVDSVASFLVEGGLFVFSVEHPMCTAIAQQRWVRDTKGNALYWPVDGYRDEGPRKTHWFVDGVIKYHRTIETYVNSLVNSGFSIRCLKEPEPLNSDISDRIPDVDLHRRRPPFLLIAAEKV